MNQNAFKLISIARAAHPPFSLAKKIAMKEAPRPPSCLTWHFLVGRHPHRQSLAKKIAMKEAPRPPSCLTWHFLVG